MRAELIKLHKRLGATMVYVTHDQTEAMSMGDRLIVMKDGVVQQVGAPLDIYHNPANQFVAGFIGSPPMNFINAEIVELDGCYYLGSDGLAIRLPDEKRKAVLALRGRRVTLGIRPEDIHEKAMFARPIDENVVIARVEILEPLGSEVLATFSLGEAEITARLSPRTQVKSDQTIELVFDMERAKLFDPASGKALT
jgi:multiple sugar transport system ATP-binding protein